MSVKRFKLKAGHTGRSKSGHSLCVLERGLVRFAYPRHWILVTKDDTVHLHDRPPSVESCDLGVSIFPIPKGEVPELSLDELLEATLKRDRDPYQQSAIHHVTNSEMQIAWVEQRFVDREYKRDARFRVALVRGPVICLITLNYWSNRAPGLERVWDEVLRTLVFGERVEDPTAGPVIQ